MSSKIYLNVFFFWGLSVNAYALTFDLTSDSNVVGEISGTTLEEGETLADVGRRTDTGLLELIEANPHVHPWRAKAGTEIIIPSQFILPPGVRSGMVINLPELRMYYYHSDGSKVSTYPIAIGKQGWETPTASTKIIDKTENPTWTVPETILAEKRASGIFNFPKVVPPGPKNPLGRYAFRLSLNGYLIHGTNTKGGIGSRVSHGCMRMQPEDIEELFPWVPVGTQVRIIHQPIKIGFAEGKVFLESHKPLTEYSNLNGSLESQIKDVLGNFGSYAYQMDWDKTLDTAKNQNGMPGVIGLYQEENGLAIEHQLSMSAPIIEPKKPQNMRKVEKIGGSERSFVSDDKI